MALLQANRAPGGGAPTKAEPLGPAPTVVVIEDERRLRELLLDVIPEMGFPTRGARSAEDAMEIVREVGLAAIGILVLDVQLPGMSGLEFLARLRAEGFTGEAIVLTAYASLDMAREAIREGIGDLLPKPSPLGEIEAALDRARRRLAGRRSLGDVARPLDAGEEEVVPLSEHERRQILAALARHQGNRTAAAKELGISRRTLHYKLVEYRNRGPGG